MDEEKGSNSPGPRAASVCEDVLTALSIINSGVEDFQNYTDDARKKNSVSLDSSAAVALCMQAVLRCLRDGNKRRLLVHILSAEPWTTATERSSIYGKYISGR